MISQFIRPRTLARQRRLRPEIEVLEDRLVLDASTSGQWSSVINMPNAMVHALMTPNGKSVWYWDENANDETVVTLPTDPSSTTLTFASAAHRGSYAFCSGSAMMADGRYFNAGGDQGLDTGNGTPYAYTLDTLANAGVGSWTQLPNMNEGRWYPSLTTLPNGNVLVVSGTASGGWGNSSNDQLPQVWNISTNSWQNLTNAQRPEVLYPIMYVAPDGRVFSASDSQYLDTSGTGAWSTLSSGSTLATLGVDPMWSTATMYQPGKILVAGGNAYNPTNKAEFIDLNSSNPTWQSTPNMAYARQNGVSTVLPDGKVIVFGGATQATTPPTFNIVESATTVPEEWDPATNTWTQLAPAAVQRAYHQTAMLMPDGRVLEGGGWTTNGSDIDSAQIFSPPYLFQGARPTITSAPNVASYGQTIVVKTPDAAAITVPGQGAVNLVRFGSQTHNTNPDQRLVPASFSLTSDGTGLNVTMPSGPNIAPPGYYMLFILHNGVPSIATIFRLGAAPTAPAAPTNLTATALGKTQIALSWTGSSGATGYNIYRSTSSDSEILYKTGITAISFTDTGLTNGITYYYEVSAVNSGGESGKSNEAFATARKK